MDGIPDECGGKGEIHPKCEFESTRYVKYLT